MLDFRIETFIMVCKHLNYTKAANELNLTQPAVSQHIKFLQDYYGVNLFHHTGKKIHLTKEGKILLNAMTTLKHDAIFLKEKLLEEKSKNKKIVFGTTLTVGQYVILDDLIHYTKSHPETSLQMIMGNTHDLLLGINEGNIDFAMIEGYFTSNEYDFLVYAKEPYIAICGADYVLEKDNYCIEDLFNERLLTREQGSGSREILEKYLYEHNYTYHDFKDVFEMNSIQPIIRFVQENCGITFIYKKAIEQELKKGTVKQIPLNDFNVVHDITFVWRKNSIFVEEYHQIFNELTQIK